MREPRLSPTACISTGWRTFWKKPDLGLLMVGCMFAISLAGSIPLLGWLATLLFAAAVQGGIYRLAVRLVRGDTQGFKDVTEVFRRWYRFLGAQVIISLIVFTILVPGLAVLIISGALSANGGGDWRAGGGLGLLIGFALMTVSIFVVAWLAIRWMFAIVVLADRPEVGIMDSLKVSWDLTRDRFWRLVGLSLLAAGVVLAGILCLLIGIVVAIPIVLIASGSAYEQIRESVPVTAATVEVPPPTSSPAPIG